MTNIRNQEDNLQFEVFRVFNDEIEHITGVRRNQLQIIFFLSLHNQYFLYSVYFYNTVYFIFVIVVVCVEIGSQYYIFYVDWQWERFVVMVLQVQDFGLEGRFYERVRHDFVDDAADWHSLSLVLEEWDIDRIHPQTQSGKVKDSNANEIRLIYILFHLRRLFHSLPHHQVDTLIRLRSHNHGHTVDFLFFVKILEIGYFLQNSLLKLCFNDHI